MPELERLTGKEARTVVLGHLQRGGSPSSYDRILATRFGARAVELLMAGEFGNMVAFHPPDIVAVPLEKIVGRTRTVPLDFDMIRTARAMGISLGD
jgi:6-phosphofructokinase 1